MSDFVCPHADAHPTLYEHCLWCGWTPKLEREEEES